MPHENVQLLASLLQRLSTSEYNRHRSIHHAISLLKQNNLLYKLSAIFIKSFLFFSLERENILFDGSIFAFPETVNLVRRFHSDDFANLDFICFLQRFNRDYRK